MFKTLSRFNEFVETYKAASEVVGLDLVQIGSRAPQEILNKTEITQIIVLTHSLAIYNILSAHGVTPTAVAGHSLGEFSALVAAKAMRFEDALRLIRKRARLMASVLRKGAMISIAGLTREVVESFCAMVNPKGIATIALHNTVNQFVVSGDVCAIEEVSLLARKAGALKVALLKVSQAFHSPLMEEIVDKYAALIDEAPLCHPICPVIMNRSAALESDAAVVKSNLKEQITQPVYWFESMETMFQQGYIDFIEAGPGKTLCGFMRSANPHVNTYMGDSAKTIAGLMQVYI
jgi:[acyl-carrier-protein] S-malonyltransferase